MKAKKHIYPVEFDPELYVRLKEYAASHGKQSIGSVVRCAVGLFLAGSSGTEAGRKLRIIVDKEKT